MESISNPKPRQNRPAYLLAAALLGAIGLIVYGWVYFKEPFTPISAYLNDKVGDVLILIPAVTVAILGTLLTRHFKSSEPPHRIWLTFTLGWWCWVGGELLGLAYDAVYWTTDYPELTYIDVAWILGYFFFGLSLYYQFRLIYNWKSQRKSALYLFYVALALIVTYGLMRLALGAGLGEGISLPALYIAVIYPVLDAFAGGAALWLFFLFGRGYLGRPWWGLIAFAIADGINIFFWIGGYNWVSDSTYYLLDLVSAVMYMGGYVITMLAILSAIDHMHRSLGTSAPASAEPSRD